MGIYRNFGGQGHVSTKGKFNTESGGKRKFPPEWYAAQAARRKKNADGSYKEGKFKESRKRLELKDPSKPKRKMPDSWYENQAKKAAERKKAQAEGTYTRKVRGKASEYRDKKTAELDKSAGFKSSGKSERKLVTIDSYESAHRALMGLYKGSKCRVEDSSGKEVEVTVSHRGTFPGEFYGASSDGRVHKINRENITGAYFD